MHLEGTDVAMVQLDGPRQQVYIKFKEYRTMQETLMSTNGQGELRHSNGVISKVRIEAAGLGIRRVRIANLPPPPHPRNFRQSDQDGPEQIRGDQRGPRRNMVTRLPVPSG
jgi:hypothetical protein